ncbi:hypothetical protein ANCDUO_20330 [Ancylostoma duodenale]|uniref:Beta-sarcoglycan n=1 Tax=Ancylostoma duodenale TaxID=51022 RepID=A0A0C2FLV7_9BILA|nr:hypothetical protein ANCDUO_20330 [Ancylostoma duodenale]
MPPPAYMRSGSETSFPSASDSRDASMTVTGLREKKLYALIGCLAILTILALFLLIMNIMLIVSLQMNQHGMKFLRLHNVFNPKAGEMEKVRRTYFSTYFLYYL